jgi:hypothetical protein
MISVVEALISTNPKEVQAHYAKMEPLWIRLRAEREKDMKAKQDKLHADWAKTDTDQDKRRATMKAVNEMTEKREAERKAE